MAPELQILAINAVALGVGYGFILPALNPLTPLRMALADLGIGLAALGTAGALFWGSGTGFWLLGVQANWFVFALVTLVAMEVPLLWRFLRARGGWPGP